jgi:hypothetical protein
MFSGASRFVCGRVACSKSPRIGAVAIPRMGKGYGYSIHAGILCGFQIHPSLPHVDRLLEVSYAITGQFNFSTVTQMERWNGKSDNIIEVDYLCVFCTRMFTLSPCAYLDEFAHDLPPFPGNGCTFAVLVVAVSHRVGQQPLRDQSVDTNVIFQQLSRYPHDGQQVTR